MSSIVEQVPARAGKVRGIHRFKNQEAGSRGRCEEPGRKHRPPRFATVIG